MMDTNRIREFLRALAKSLGASSLYGLEHPAAKGAMEASYAVLRELTDLLGELTVVDAGDKLVVNGEAFDDSFGIRPLFAKLSVHSFTFSRGLKADELAGLLRLLTAEAPADISGAAAIAGIVNIKINGVHYIKAGAEASPGASAPAGGLSHAIEGLPFESMLSKVIEKAVPDDSDRKKVFEIVISRFKGEVETKISEATSELKKERDGILRDKETAEGLIENSVTGVITVDGTGKVVMLDVEAEKAVGTALKALAGRFVWDGVGEGQMVTYAPEPGEGYSTGKVVVRGEDETKRLIKASNAVIRDVSGKMVGMYSTLMDMTKYRELDRLKRDFVASVTHELRTPIAATRQALSNLLELTKLDGDQRSMLQISLRNTERLLRLVNEILDFSKLEAGKMKVAPAIVEAGPLLREAVASLKPFAGAKGVSLSLEAPPALPRLLVDRDRIAQVLVNLLSNAIKFTGSGGAVAVIASGLSGTAVSPFLRVSVKDSGCGIAPEDVKKVFEKFVQVGDKKGSVPGTGLGLTITKALVELHGGEVMVESSVGAGSTFSVTLPILPEDAVFLKGREDRDEGRPAKAKGS